MADFVTTGECGAVFTHQVGDKDCKTCYSDPILCVCGGLIHQDYFDEDWDNVFTSKSCDRCGDKYREA